MGYNPKVRSTFFHEVCPSRTMLSQHSLIEKDLQTSFFSLGKPVSEITTQSSTPSKNNTNESVKIKKKINIARKMSRKDVNCNQSTCKTSTTPSSKGTPVGPGQKAKKKVNRKLPVPEKPEPSVYSKITETIPVLSEGH